MCKYLTRTGNFCTNSPSKDRCWLHPISKYPPHIACPIKAEEAMKIALNTQFECELICPCGSKTKRWNYAVHCKVPKHIAWMETMPETKTGWRTKPLEYYAKSLEYHSWLNEKAMIKHLESDPEALNKYINKKLHHEDK